MKRLLTYLFLVLGLGLVFNSNSYSADVEFTNCALYKGEKNFHTTFKINLKRNKIYYDFFAEGEIYSGTYVIIENDDTQVVSSIKPWGTEKNQFHQYIFDKKTNDVFEVHFKDKLGKIEIEDEETKLHCDDVVGKWKDQIITTKGKYYALIVGNNDYQHLEGLDAAVNDAREIGKVLERKYEFEVTHLYNATRKDTVKEMHYISRKLNNEDSLLIYYAGHGIFDKDEDEGYWLPVDAVKNTSAEGIGNAWITKQVKATKARHVLLLIDSCFAGSITKTRSASNLVPREELDLRFIERKSSKKSRMVITSGGNEPVVDSDGGDHSWFAKKLLEILNENNDVIYSLNIYDELQKYVINNADQTPAMAVIKGTGHNEGEFFFYSKN